MDTSRRYFLKTASAFALGFGGLQTLVGCRTPRPPRRAAPADDFGALVPDPAGILDLPEGFSYQVISRTGDRMADGFFVPAAADGMAAFPGPEGTTLLVRNHEISGLDPASGAFGPGGELAERLDAGAFYDAGREAGRPCLGGTTTLVYDTRAQRLVSQHLSLAGTVRNCAGGPTPWNTWVTCEETTVRAGEGRARDHGYTFEVPASATPGLATPVPIEAMGRFVHEAVAVHPKTSIVYQTEDQGDGLIYRYVPDAPGKLLRGGRLQALAVVDRPSLDVRNWDEQTVAVGESLPVRWIDLDGVDAPDDDLRLRGFEQGAARFTRGEGMWYGNGAVYFACTDGGHIRKGQIWRYVPSPHEGTRREAEEPGQLELFVEPEDAGLIDNADNVTVAPWGDLVVCEDGSGEQYLSGITPDGHIYKIGHNAHPEDSEFAGSTFSPDGTTLFVNIQDPGLTLAITGPWKA